MTPGLIQIFMCASVASQFTRGCSPLTTSFFRQNVTSNTITMTTTTSPPAVQLYIQAVPEHLITTSPVLLSCVANVSVPVSITWIWEHQTVVDKIHDPNNMTWTEEGSGPELSLTSADQSGVYRCRANSPNREFNTSNLHEVYIVDIHRTAVDNLGIAGFAFSILAILLNLAVVGWLVYPKSINNTTAVVPSTKTGPPNIPQPMDVAPPVDSDRDVYMNYTNSNYTDLDPNNINEDSLYSSLS